MKNLLKLIENETVTPVEIATKEEVMRERIEGKEVSVGLAYDFSEEEGCLFSYMSKDNQDRYIVKYEYARNIDPYKFLDEVESYNPKSLKITTNNPFLFTFLNYYDDESQLKFIRKFEDEGELNYLKFKDFSRDNIVRIISNKDDERTSLKYKMLSMCYANLNEEVGMGRKEFMTTNDEYIVQVRKAIIEEEE